VLKRDGIEESERNRERKKTEREKETNRMVAHTEVRVGWDGMSD
jgi:hypothetical protein